MKAKMNKSKLLYTSFTALFACLFFLTGCPHNVSDKPVTKTKTKDVSYVRGTGTVNFPSAMPSEFVKALEQNSSRTAAPEYSVTDDGKLIRVEVYAESDNYEEPVTASVFGPGEFSLLFPPEEEEWTIGARCYFNQEMVMETTPRTISVDGRDIENGSFKIRAFTLDLSTLSGTGSLYLPFYRPDASSISKIEYELSSNVLDNPITGDLFLTSSYITYLQKADLAAGTYEAKFYFIDEKQMKYGPVQESFIIVPNLRTNLWYDDDQAIAFVKEVEQNEYTYTVFQIPDDATLKAMFPYYVYSGTVSTDEDIVVLWNKDSDAGELPPDIPVMQKGYSVYKLNSVMEASDPVYIGDGVGYPLAAGKNVVDFKIDYQTKDIYIQENDTTISKYLASSGYSQCEAKMCPEGHTICAIAADNNNCYAFTYDGWDCYLCDFSSSMDETMSLVAKIDMESSLDPEEEFNMAASGKYIFVTLGSTVSLKCYLFNTQVGEQSGGVLTLENYWDNYYGLDYDVPGVFDMELDTSAGLQVVTLPLFVQDLIAVPKTVTDPDENDVPDLYVLLGYSGVVKTIQNPYTLLDEQIQGSYGCVIKVQTEGDSELCYPKDFGNTDFGVFGLVDQMQENFIYAPENATNQFYHPVKFQGYKNGKLIIVDDGATMTVKEVVVAGQKVFMASTVNENRILSMDLSDKTLTSADVGVSFDNYSYLQMGSKVVLGNYDTSSTETQTQNGFYNIQDEEYPEMTIGCDPWLDIKVLTLRYNSSNKLELKNEYKFPFSRGGKAYITTSHALPYLTYDSIVVYCNGKVFENDPQDPYFTIDLEEGSLTMLRPLPSMSYEYKLEVKLSQVIPDPDGGDSTVIHYDFLKEITPDTTFRMVYPRSDEAIYEALASYLIADKATIEFYLNGAPAGNGISDANEKKQRQYEYVSAQVELINSYFRDNPCPNLTLDYSQTGDLVEITAGMFGVNCSKIILPIKQYEKFNAPEKICRDAFRYKVSNDNYVVFEGDLVIHKSLAEIEQGAFSIPPRSITIDEDAYVASGARKFYTTKINGNIPVLATNSQIDYMTRIVCCTKRDVPFTLDLSSGSYMKEIDENAFKGLPLYSNSANPLQLGSTKYVHDGAFENTSVKSIEGNSLILIGHKAFPNFEDSELTAENVNNWYVYSTASTYETTWNTIAAGTKITVTDDDKVPGYSEGTLFKTILDDINNSSKCFVFKQLES